MNGSLGGMDRETLNRMGGSVGHIPQRGSPRFYSEEEIGQPDESSEVEVERVPPKEELRKLPKTVFLKIAIELNPEKVAEFFREGWTKDDILRIIERHLSSSLGQTGTEGGEYIHDIEVLESSTEDEE